MLFTYLQYYLLLPFIVVIYYYLKKRDLRILFLLLVSYAMYCVFSIFHLLILIYVSLITYVAGILIEKYKKSKKKILISYLVLVLAPLLYYKYYNFFIINISAAVNYLFPAISTLLPIGISFYTFQAISYVGDVYVGRIRAEKDVFTLLLFISFFPQLVAGPIERAGHIINQLKAKNKFTTLNLKIGLELILIGLIKKFVVADTIATYIDTPFAHPELHSGLDLLVSVLLFGFQIYYDFSGYTDIARGSARLFGIDLMENFNLPYISKTLKEFWRRWHISLSYWLRDYIYIPLGGNRKGTIRWGINILIVFFISGLWHGANWTYVLWGVSHGAYMIFERILYSLLPFLEHISILFTFSFVMLSWVFFRSPNLHSALIIFSKIFTDLNSSLNFISMWGLIKFIAFILIIEVHIYITKSQKYKILKEKNEYFQIFIWFYYATLITLLILFGRFYSPEAFIYFRF